MEQEYSDEMAEKVNKKTMEYYEAFKTSPQFSKMFKYCQKEAKAVVECLGEFTYGYELITPEEWNIDVFIGQAYNIQRKCMFSNDFFKAFPKVIYHFSKFCYDAKIGNFDKESIETFNQDLKEGYYEEEFHSSWEEGSKKRQIEAKKMGF